MVVPTTTPIRRSERFGVGLDGASATDEDVWAMAMRRKATRNLDPIGYLPLHSYSSIMVGSSACGAPGFVLGGIVAIGGGSQGAFLPA